MPPRRRTARPVRVVKPMGRPTAITGLGARTPFKKWLVYGPVGCGKTVLGGTMPDGVFLEFDPEGTESAEVHGSAAQLWQIDTWKEYNQAIEYFERGSGCKDFDWVCIDTVSEGEDVCWADQLQTMVASKPGTRSLYKPALDDYPIVWNKTKSIIERFNRLPINVLYTAHVMGIEQWDDDREEDYAEKMPMLGSTKNGVLSRKVCAKVSLVGYLEARKRKVEDEEGETTIEEYRKLTVTSRRDLIAKNRYGWQKVPDNPDLPTLITAANRARERTEPSTPTRPARRRRTG